MLRRVLTGATLVVVTVGAWWIDSSTGGTPWALSVLGAVLALGALDELVRMGGAPIRRRHVALLAGLVWLAGLAFAGRGGNEAVVLLGDVLTAGSAVAGLVLVGKLRQGPGEGVVRLVRSVWFDVPYVGGLGCLVALVMAGNVDFVVATVLVVKSSDIGAYFAGKSLGRRKLAPRISPGKTVEGAIGGVLLPALVAAWLLDGTLVGHADGVARALPGGTLGAALHGAALGGLAIVSDLAESLLKRSCDVKDSGTLFGESGGFLDLADSLLLVGPFLLAYTAVLA